MFCSKCGKKIENFEKFCTNCGNEIGSIKEQNNTYYNKFNCNQQVQDNNRPINNNYNNNKALNCTANFNEIKLSQPRNKNFNTKKLLIAGIIILISICMIIIGASLLSKKESYSRTIMIYMVGSNLETDAGLGTVDLNSINYKTMDNQNINVVLIAGGAEEWNNNYISKNETSIYELTINGYQKVKTQSILNMGSSNVLSDYLNYVYDNYKTDEYDLIFWNHGGALMGSEFDDLSGDYLSLEEIKTGLKNSSFKDGNKLETVIFRTCLNGTIEMADILKDYSDYLVASEEVTLGAPIASVLSFVNEIESDDTGKDVGIKFVQSYKNQIGTLKEYYGSSEYIYSTYSVVDLSKIESLVSSFNNFISDISISENYNNIAKVRSNLYQYGYTTSDEPTYDMVDLYNLVNELKEFSPTKANDILEKIESAIVYNWATNDKSRGISIYFPYNATDSTKAYFLNVYDKLDSFSNYNNFISNFYLTQKNGTSKYSFTQNKTLLTTENNISDFSLELTDEQLEGFAKAEVSVFVDKGDGYFWTVAHGKKATLDGNVLRANINNNHLKIDDFIIPLVETANEEKYLKWKAYVMLADYRAENISDWKVDSAELSFIYDKQTSQIKIGSVILTSSDENKLNNIAVNLNDYEYITFGSSSRKILDEEGNFDEELYQNSSNGIFEGADITVEEIQNFKLSNFNDENDYYCIFKIYDVNNNYYYSKLVKMN